MAAYADKVEHEGKGMGFGIEKMAEIVPEGEYGNCEVRHIDISEAISRLSALRPMNYTPPGKYAQLLISKCLVMSDTRSEQVSNYDFIMKAQGDVLIAGLGLGMVLIPVLRKEKVRSVLVIEKNYSVIRLVKPALIRHLDFEHSQKLRVVENDIFEWKPTQGKKWDTIYFDIWRDICTDNLTGVSRLKRRFAKRLNRNTPGAWMAAWEEQRLRNKKRREKREAIYDYGYRCRTLAFR